MKHEAPSAHAGIARAQTTVLRRELSGGEFDWMGTLLSRTSIISVPSAPWRPPFRSCLWLRARWSASSHGPFFCDCRCDLRRTTCSHLPSLLRHRTPDCQTQLLRYTVPWRSSRVAARIPPCVVLASASDTSTLCLQPAFRCLGHPAQSCPTWILTTRRAIAPQWLRNTMRQRLMPT